MGIYYLLFTFLLMGCTDERKAEIPKGNYTKVQEIPLPDGFVRDTTITDSFVLYLRNLPLKKDTKVLLHNGNPKKNQNAQYAVIDMEIGKRDLQQCADAVIRLRSEYLYQQKKYTKIHYNFANGVKADYTHYAEGNRAVVLNNQVRWAKTAEKDYSYPTFRKYLDLVFTYANTQSLNKEVNYIEQHELRAGDIFLQTGFPYGHAVTIVDVAVNKETGVKAFLLAQSFMPAQEIHILKNPEKENDPWYYSDFKYKLITPEWEFTADDLKRFNN